MQRRQWLMNVAAGLATVGLHRTSLAQATSVEVWKDPNCGCCQAWVQHLEANGFKVAVRNVGNSAARQRLGMPAKLGSCHTATVGGYVIEGHVPATDIHRLLKTRPKALGLAVPGMPVGSPGMDGPEYGGRQDAFDVLLVQKDGSTLRFAHHAGARPTAQRAGYQKVSETAVALPWIAAEVRRIDTSGQKVTLKHGDITNLDMPAMSMVFKVKNPQQLQGLQVGQKVRFRASEDQGTFWVEQIEPAAM